VITGGPPTHHIVLRLVVLRNVEISNAKPDVRLGGIYALRQIAHNSTYTRPIVEIFVAYLRSHSSAKPLSSAEPAPSTKQVEAPVKSDAVEPHPYRTDLRAVLRTLIIDGLWNRAGAGRLDLSFITVPRAELSRADLRGCVLVGADLPHADLREAQLVESDLRRIRLTHANLERADLTSQRPA
jgi:uncharacterized protein YjbI with pentapeptide repeats